MSYKDAETRRAAARDRTARRRAEAEAAGEGKPEPAKARRRRPEGRVTNAEYAEGSRTDGKVCGAKKNKGVDLCSLPAGYGTDHLGFGPCKHHMGSTPNGRKSAAIERGEELMVFYGKPLDTNPIEALLDEVKTTAGHKAWLAAEIAKVDIELVSAQGRVTGLPPEVEGLLRLYQWERDHLVNTAKKCLDAGINERLVQIAEHQGTKLADAIDTILAGLQLTAAQRALVPGLVPGVLRGLVGSQPRLIEGIPE